MKTAAALILLVPPLLVAGCRSPFGPHHGEDAIWRQVNEAIDREMADLPPSSGLREATRPPPVVEQALLERRGELEAIGPTVPFARGELQMGPDLTGAEQREVAVSLRSTIVSAVKNNLSIQIARLLPAIDEARVVAAEAAFDAVFFANAEAARIDEPQSVPVINGIPIGIPFSNSETYRFATGLRAPLTTGGVLTIQTDLDRFRNFAPIIDFSPDPAYAASVRLGIVQPLLRGFGTQVNTASIRLARNLERRSIEQLRADLLDLIERTESAYWDLAFAWQNLEIQKWLLDVGVQVRDVMEGRRGFDTSLAEYAAAVARVEQRKGNVIRARRGIRAASDVLKVLINDPELTVGSEVLLVPVDRMVEAPIRYSLREAIVTGVGARPQIQQSILAIDDAGIRQMLADNARLPLLNFAAELSYFGLDDGPGSAYANTFEGSFVNWLLAADFEWPLGNRAAEAEFRMSRLERSATVIAYQQAVQDVIFDVKTALRDCVTSYELIEANRSFRVAQTENLRALLVEEETLAGLTPEFLDLKFTRQETLAQAQQQETAALVAYNKSVSALYRSMGIGLAMNQIELDVESESARPGGAPDSRDQ